LTRSATDRNRTSTFAFTGNKFEFRAVGASHSPSKSNAILNTILADSVRELNRQIVAQVAKGTALEEAVVQVTRATLRAHERIIFNGNGYSADWPVEAKRRGLLNLRTTPEALALYASPKNIELHESLGVLTRAELEARQTVYLEEYIKRINVEAKVFINMVRTGVVPAAVDYINKLKSAVDGKDSKSALAGVLAKVSTALESAITGADSIEESLHGLHGEGITEAKAATHAESVVLHRLTTVRVFVDTLETLLPADHWPFPTYHQMLFHQD
jgi:glutamine synthetase